MAHDTETGEVTRDQVLLVLKLSKVDVSSDPEHSGNFLLIKGTVVRSIPLEDWVLRRQLQQIGRIFGIYTYHFYHPEMLGGTGAIN
jgi:hypothetical protein